MTLKIFPSGSQTSIVERLGRYHLLAPLAQSALARVHLAVADSMGEPRKLFAIRELRSALSTDPDFVQAFKAEAERTLRLTHPNIVQALELGREGDRQFLVNEFVAGPTLAELLERVPREPSISLVLRVQLLCEALAGLHYAHEQCEALVHRDFGPHNVFVTYQGQTKVGDFAIAKARETLSDGFNGQFVYAAPELVLRQAADRRADVFSAGVMLWEMCTGRPFSSAHATAAAIQARTAGAELRLAFAAPDLPAELAAICDRALQIRPEDRFPNADALRQELLAFAQRHGELAEPAAIGELVRSVFASERAAMQDLIRSQIKRLLPLDDNDTSHSEASAASAVRHSTPIASTPETQSDAGVRTGWYADRPPEPATPRLSPAPAPRPFVPSPSSAPAAARVSATSSVQVSPVNAAEVHWSGTPLPRQKTLLFGSARAAEPLRGSGAPATQSQSVQVRRNPLLVGNTPAFGSERRTPLPDALSEPQRRAPRRGRAGRALWLLGAGSAAFCAAFAWVQTQLGEHAFLPLMAASTASPRNEPVQPSGAAPQVNEPTAPVPATASAAAATAAPVTASERSKPASSANSVASTRRAQPSSSTSALRAAAPPTAANTAASKRRATPAPLANSMTSAPPPSAANDGAPAVALPRRASHTTGPQPAAPDAPPSAPAAPLAIQDQNPALEPAIAPRRRLEAGDDLRPRRRGLQPRPIEREVPLR